MRLFSPPFGGIQKVFEFSEKSRSSENQIFVHFTYPKIEKDSQVKLDPIGSASHFLWGDNKAIFSHKLRFFILSVHSIPIRIF